MASQLYCLADSNAELAVPRLLSPVNCIKIGGHVALLSGPTVYSLYFDSAPLPCCNKQPTATLASLASPFRYVDLTSHHAPGTAEHRWRGGGGGSIAKVAHRLWCSGRLSFW